MAITGGIKFFAKSKSLGVDGATCAASPSGDSSAAYCLDQNPVTVWRSVASNDLTVETLTITFTESKTFTRLFLLGHNWKQFTAKYWNGSAWTNFAAVVGLDSSGGSAISETTFADSTAYYEFTSVSTTSIQLTVTKTQTADQEKYLSQVICTTEIGTFAGYPEVKGLDFDRNAKVNRTSGGKYSVQKGDETVGFQIDFKNYPSSSTYNVDINTVLSLQDSEDPFLVWLCGGRRGTTYFKYILRGYRIGDVYQMQITKPLKLSYSGNVYINPLNANVVLEESI